MTFLQQAEWALRHRITYPVLRRLFRNTPARQPIDIRSIRSILLLRYDRFGDMVVTSPITRHLRVLNPDVHIGIAASASNSELARQLPGGDTVHVVTGNAGRVISSLRSARRHRYDVVLNFIMNRTTTGGILANVIGPGGIKVGQGAAKYGFYFNLLLDLGKGKIHMANLLDSFCLAAFGDTWGSPDLRYEIRPEKHSEERVHGYLAAGGHARRDAHRKLVIVNISAGESRRDPDIKQMTRIARYLAAQKGRRVVVVGAPSRLDQVRTIVRGASHPNVTAYPKEGAAPFMDMVSLVRRASYLVSPDTSLVHVACATGTPVVGLYANLVDFTEWSPVGIRYELVIDPAYERVRNISVTEIMTGVDRLEQRIGLSS